MGSLLCVIVFTSKLQHIFYRNHTIRYYYYIYYIHFIILLLLEEIKILRELEERETVNNRCIT